MMTLLITPAVAMSDAKDWTMGKKIVAIAWMAILDVLIFAMI